MFVSALQTIILAPNLYYLLLQYYYKPGDVKTLFTHYLRASVDQESARGLAGPFPSESLTKLPSGRRAGLWSHLRLKWGRICFQVIGLLAEAESLTSCQSESFIFLLAVD